MAYSTKLSELVSGCKTGGKYVDPHYGLGGEHKLPVLTRLRQNYLCAGISFFLTESFRYVHGFVFVCLPVELCLETQHKRSTQHLLPISWLFAFLSIALHLTGDVMQNRGIMDVLKSAFSRQNILHSQKLLWSFSSFDLSNFCIGLLSHPLWKTLTLMLMFWQTTITLPVKTPLTLVISPIGVNWTQACSHYQAYSTHIVIVLSSIFLYAKISFSETLKIKQFGPLRSRRRKVNAITFKSALGTNSVVWDCI